MINQDLGLKLNMLLECELPKGRTVFLHIHLPMEEPGTEESLSRGLMKEVVLMDAPQPKALSVLLGPLRFNRAWILLELERQQVPHEYHQYHQNTSVFCLALFSSQQFQAFLPP